MVSGGEGVSRIRRVIRGLTIAILILAGTVLAAVNWWESRVSEPHLGRSTENRLLTVPFGSSVRSIGQLLQGSDIIRSDLIFSAYVRMSGPDPLQAGEYLFENPISLIQVVRILREGRVHHYRITIPEGLTMDEIIDRFVQEGLGQRHELEPLIGRTDLLGGLDPEATDLEGYLFPDTYHFTRAHQEPALVSALVTRFMEVWTPLRQKRADELGLTIREVITLASLIEKETALPAERPLVSAVFHNRLRRNIKLDCDPTVIYAIRKTGEYDGVLRKSDLALDSPYNTYLYRGLPPGPIANPGTASIDAALNPAPVRHLYFVSKNDGSHVFSTSYREHRRAVRRYQR